MFENHHWPESNRKRLREEEDEAMNGTLGFTEHRNVSELAHLVSRLDS
jgi:hypothetical protein